MSFVLHVQQTNRPPSPPLHLPCCFALSLQDLREDVLGSLIDADWQAFRARRSVHSLEEEDAVGMLPVETSAIVTLFANAGCSGSSVQRRSSSNGSRHMPKRCRMRSNLEGDAVC